MGTIVSLVAASSTAAAQEPWLERFAIDARLHVILGQEWPGRPERDGIEAAVVRLYTPADVRPLWSAGGRATPQALEVIRILAAADTRGLVPGDYELDGVGADLAAIDTEVRNVEGIARFDVSLSRSVIRFLSDLHRGRVEPAAVGFDIAETHGTVDFAVLARAVSRAADVDAMVSAAEPAYAGYQELLRALGTYRRLAADTALRHPRELSAPIRPGDPYGDAPALRRFLVAVGDLSPDAPAIPNSTGTETYAGPLVDAVMAFQRRHGLEPDGVIGRGTIAQLRLPMARRVRQIELTLERWRWLPDRPPPRYAVVNIPAFRLSVFDGDIARPPVLTMAVVVGEADGRHHTPVFAATMAEIVFRPYWNVPPRIARRELVPLIRRRPEYLDREGLEIVRGGDLDAVVYPPTEEHLSMVAAGALRLRQRPGPRNALGLVKFVFPNRYNVYMHDTPARELFARPRRDFSHGCIRVEDPAALAELLLRDRPEWDRAAIQRAMAGARTLRIPLAAPVGVFILYATAEADADGQILFHGDLYGHDSTLERVLGLTPPNG